MRSANRWRAAVILGTALALPAAAQPTAIQAEFQNGAFPYTRYEGATDITITVQDDADKDPNQNYASKQGLAADGFSARQASLMRFPMDGGAIPPGATIQGAELQLFITNETYTGSAAYEMLRPWSEGEATYLRPAAGQTWAGEGASAVGVDRGSEPFVRFRQLDAGFYNILAVSDAGVDLVRRWYSGASPNNGLILQDYDSWDKVVAASSETSTPPILKVFYSTGAGASSAPVPASEDTMIVYQPANYEGWGLGLSGRTGLSTSSLLRWDLRAIPRDATIIYLELDLTVNKLAASSTVMPFDVYAASVPWTEKADWRSYDGMARWSDAGAQGPGDHGVRLDSLTLCGTLGSQCASPLGGSWTTVEGWISDPTSNHGFLIQNYVNQDDLVVFDSEAPAVSRRPKLKVAFIWPARRLPGLYPAYAEVYPGDPVQMIAFAGAGAYQYSVAAASGGTINPNGLYQAGLVPGTDIVRVLDQGGAGDAGFATIVVLDKTPDGGSTSQISIAFTSEPVPVQPQDFFAVTADVTSRASFPVSNLTLALSGQAVIVNSAVEVGKGALREVDAGFALPRLDPGAVVHLSISSTMYALPSDSPSITASVRIGSTEVASATTPVPLDELVPIETGCGCDEGLGGNSLALAIAAIMILQTRCARAASIAAARSCARRISPD